LSMLSLLVSQNGAAAETAFVLHLAAHSTPGRGS
jgi:hypothetical protein